MRICRRAARARPPGPLIIGYRRSCVVARAQDHPRSLQPNVSTEQSRRPLGAPGGAGCRSRPLFHNALNGLPATACWRIAPPRAFPTPSCPRPRSGDSGSNRHVLLHTNTSVMRRLSRVRINKEREQGHETNSRAGHIGGNARQRLERLHRGARRRRLSRPLPLSRPLLSPLLSRLLSPLPSSIRAVPHPAVQTQS